MNSKLPLIIIEFKDGEGKFLTSRWARFGTLADLKYDLQFYFKRFPSHTATFRFAIED
jgi:hypothetical protein